MSRCLGFVELDAVQRCVPKDGILNAPAVGLWGFGFRAYKACKSGHSCRRRSSRNSLLVITVS